MKIIYLHQYFCTPSQGGGTRSYHIAKAMVEAGHSVDLITSHNQKEYMIERTDGIRVHYLPIAYSNHFNSSQRIWSFILFALKSYKIAKRINCDLVYATSTPLTVGWAALRLHTKKAIPYIFEVRDLWPLAPKELGVIKNKWIFKLLEKLERKIYLRADHIVALSPTMKTHICQHVDYNKVSVVPNFANNELSEELRTDYNKEYNQKIKIVYAGALGYANDIPFLHQFIDLIDSKFQDKIEFSILGDGRFAGEIKLHSEKTSNTKFIGFVSKEKVYKKLLEADFSLTTFLSHDVLRSNSPNKFFDGLATETIPFINFGGWLSDLIQTHNCGVNITIETLEKELQNLIKNPSIISQMKQNAKEVGLSFFDKDLLCKKIVDILNLDFKKQELKTVILSSKKHS